MEPATIVGNVYQLLRKIGAGSFGEIFLGEDIRSGETVAVKVERKDAKYPQLAAEYKVYMSVPKVDGVPDIRWFGSHGAYNVMVMELLGDSLESLFCRCGRRFSLKTVLILGIEMLLRLEHHHTNNYIHRDIKPDNFLMGAGDKPHVVHLIDMGLCKRFRDPHSHRHIPFKENKKMVGTLRYASINAHRGYEQSRRDDLESVGYLLLYFLNGRLPWQGLTARTKQEKYDLISKKKIETSLEQLCANVPAEFCSYLGYCRGLRFDEAPDYDYLRSLFINLYAKEQFLDDFMFDWMLSLPDEQRTPRSAYGTLCEVARIRDREALVMWPREMPNEEIDVEGDEVIIVPVRMSRQMSASASASALYPPPPQLVGVSPSGTVAGNVPCNSSIPSPVCAGAVVGTAAGSVSCQVQSPAAAATLATAVAGGGGGARLSPQPALVAVQSPRSHLQLLPNYACAQVPNAVASDATPAALIAAPVSQTVVLAAGDMPAVLATPVQPVPVASVADPSGQTAGGRAVPPTAPCTGQVDDRRALLDAYDAVENERDRWKRRCEELEQQNQQLSQQLQELQSAVQVHLSQLPSRKRRASAQMTSDTGDAAPAAPEQAAAPAVPTPVATRKSRRVAARATRRNESCVEAC